jgi:pimeloyl-ACP methyl ester carboxylesterase
MPTADIDGTTIAYEIIGRGKPWVLTPGGRFSKDTPGLRELATALAAGGKQVLIWDRPNTGASDVCFEGPSESDMQADRLAGLLRTLDMAPAVIFGGSGGSRVSLLTAVNHPDVAAGLAMVWISGGVYGLMLLATHYCGESIRAAWQGGMEAVVELPEWAEVIERNPPNRDHFLRLDPREFIATLERWMLAYCPDPGTTVPGLPDAKCGALDIPTLVFRSGTSDPHHTRATSERVHELIRGSRLVEPPWGDDEWKQRGEAARNGSGHLFERWPLLAPQLLAFFDAVEENGEKS